MGSGQVGVPARPARKQAAGTGGFRPRMRGARHPTVNKRDTIRWQHVLCRDFKQAD